MTTGFSDPVVAAEFRDFIQQQIKTEVKKNIEYRYGEVVTISADHKDITVKFANDATAVKVVLGDTIPRSVGQIVQVLITDNQYFLTQVMGAGAVQDYIGTEFAAPGWGSPALYSAGSAITVNWSLVANALFYEVQIATNNTFTLNLQSVKTPTPGFTFTNLVADTVYYVRVRAVNSNGAEPGGPWSTIQSITCVSASFHYGDIIGNGSVPSTSPAAVVTAGIGYLIINWNPIANADPVTYEVHLSTTSGFIPSDATLCGKTQSTFFFIRTLPPDNTVPLAYGQLYFVRLVATDIDGRSTVNGAQGSGSPAQVNTGDAGQIATSELVPDGQLPASAPALSPLSAGIGFLLAKWSQVPNADPVTYDVHISTVSNFTPSANTLIFSTPSTFAFIKNVGPGAGGGVLVFGTVYYVKVLARDADGSGPASAQQSGNILKVATADISDLAITSALIADGNITTAKISDDAINAQKIGVDSVGGAALAYKDINNLIPDGSFELSSMDADRLSYATANSQAASYITSLPDAYHGSRFLRFTGTTLPNTWRAMGLTPNIPITAGEKVWVRTRIKRSAGSNGTAYIAVGWILQNGTYAAAALASHDGTMDGTWRETTSVWTAPANVRAFYLYTEIANNVTTGYTDFDAVEARKVIQTAIIDDAAITNAKIASLDAVKITTGTLDAARIAAYSISTSKLVVADLNNYAKNGDMRYPVGWNQPVIAAGTTGVPAGAPGAYVVKQSARDANNYSAENAEERRASFFPVKEGEQYYIEAWAATSNSTKIWGIGLHVNPNTDPELDGTGQSWVLGPNGQIAPSATWTKLSTYITIPAGMKWARVWAQIEATSAFGDWYFTKVLCLRKASGELIVDGAITAGKLTIGSALDSMVRNESFEDGTDRWNLDSNLTGPPVYILDTSIFDSGSKSLRMRSVGGGIARVFTQDAYPVAGGESISLTVRARAGSVTTASLNLKLFMYNSSDTYVSELTSSGFSMTTAFQTCSYQFAVPSGTGIVFVRPGFDVTAGANGIDHWVDSVRMRRVTVTAEIADGAITATKILAGSVTADKLTVGSIGDNALPNGGLEEYTDTTTPSSWTTSQSTSGWSPVTGASSISGAVSWQTPAMNNAQEASLWQHVDKMIPVVPGDQWYLSATVKASVASTDGLFLRAQWFSATKADLATLQDPVSNVGVGTSVSTKGGSVTVPANAYFMQVRLFWSGPDTGGTSALTVGEIVARHVVTSAIIADGAITTPKIVAGAITAASGIIADAAIGSAKIVDAAITTAKIADAQISSAKIQDLAVSTVKIGDAQITTAKIGDLQVTDAKIASIVANKITAGSIVADLTVSARIKTADSGARVELNSSGLKAYDSGGNNTIAVNNDGSGYFSGTVESSIIRTRNTGAGYWAELSPIDISGYSRPGALKFAENWAWCGQVWGGAGGLYFDIPNINQFHLDRIGNSTFVGNWGGRFETWQYSEAIFHDATVYASAYSTGGNITASGSVQGSSLWTNGNSVYIAGGNVSAGVENTLQNRAIFWYDGYARITERTNSIHTPIRASDFVVSSARSIKKNIKTTRYGLNDLVKLKVYDYDYRENVKDRPYRDSDTGLIADELEKVYPGVVSYDGEGVPVGIDYGRLTPLLIKAIQELNKKVEALA